MGDLIVGGGTIIDGTGKPAYVADLLLAGGRIAAGSGSSPQRLDARGKWIVPGLIDLHTHGPTPADMSLYVENGVTSTRFAGGDQQALLALRKRIEDGEIPGPRVFSCGPLLDCTPVAYAGSSVAADSPAAAASTAQRLIADEHVDALIVAQQPDLASLEAVLPIAHQAGIPVTAQTWRITAREAVLAGIDGIDNTSRIPEVHTAAEPPPPYTSISDRLGQLGHMWAQADQHLLDDLAQLMAAKRVDFCPTIVAFVSWIDEAQRRRVAEEPGYAARLSPPMEQAWLGHKQRITGAWGDAERQAWVAAIERLKAFTFDVHQRGGNVIAGTDVLFSGIHLHYELEILAAAGFSPLDALATATSKAARALRQEGDLGTLEAGKQADFLVLASDPAKDVRALRDIDFVVKGGEIVFRRNQQEGA